MGVGRLSKLESGNGEGWEGDGGRVVWERGWEGLNYDLF